MLNEMRVYCDSRNWQTGTAPVCSADRRSYNMEPMTYRGPECFPCRHKFKAYLSEGCDVSTISGARVQRDDSSDWSPSEAGELLRLSRTFERRPWNEGGCKGPHKAECYQRDRCRCDLWVATHYPGDEAALLEGVYDAIFAWKLEESNYGVIPLAFPRSLEGDD